MWSWVWGCSSSKVQVRRSIQFVHHKSKRGQFVSILLEHFYRILWQKLFCFVFYMKNNLSKAEAFILNVISGCAYVVAVTRRIGERMKGSEWHRYLVFVRCFWRQINGFYWSVCLVLLRFRALLFWFVLLLFFLAKRDLQDWEMVRGRGKTYSLSHCNTWFCIAT